MWSIASPPWLRASCQASFRMPKPVQTAWWQAWKPDEQSRCFWPGRLYIELVSPLPHLVSHLPPLLQIEYWQHFSIGDDEGLRDFEALVNSANKKAYFANLNQYPLLLILMELRAGRQRWAVFFQYNCEDIAQNLQRPWPRCRRS